MNSHDLTVIAWIVVAGILSGFAQLKLSALNPNAKRIAHLEARVKELSARLGIEEAPLSEVQELIAQGRKIHAIKLYREQTGMGLAASKEAVDAMDAQMKARSLA